MMGKLFLSKVLNKERTELRPEGSTVRELQELVSKSTSVPLEELGTRTVS